VTPQATLTATGGKVDVEGGVLDVAGTVAPRLRNGGTVAIGNEGPAQATVNGAYTQPTSGVLAIDFSDSVVDNLVVTGAASLAGRLDVLPAGPTSVGATTSTVSAASVSGAFGLVRKELTDVPLGYAVGYCPTFVTVTATSTLDDADTSIVYGGWSAESIASAFGQLDDHVSSTANDTATFAFTGTSVSWLTRTDADLGKAQVLIDGVSKGTVDLYSANPAIGVRKTFAGLANKAHTLTVKVLGQRRTASSGSAVVVDGFVVGSTTTDDSSRAIGWTGWTGAANATARQASAANRTVTAPLSGTHLDWVTQTGPGMGKARVTIDGMAQPVIDLYAATKHAGVVKSFTVPGGDHTMTITVLGQKRAASSGTTVVVDRFDWAP
jgi:hypothetical protein